MTPQTVQEMTEAQLAASESLVKVAKIQSEIEVLMRKPDPSKSELAMLRALSSDALRQYENINYWAVKSFRLCE